MCGRHTDISKETSELPVTRPQTEARFALGSGQRNLRADRFEFGGIVELKRESHRLIDQPATTLHSRGVRSNHKRRSVESKEHSIVPQKRFNEGGIAPQGHTSANISLQLLRCDLMKIPCASPSRGMSIPIQQPRYRQYKRCADKCECHDHPPFHPADLVRRREDSYPAL
jgi:hypothetical protein